MTNSGFSDGLSKLQQQFYYDYYRSYKGVILQPLSMSGFEEVSMKISFAQTQQREVQGGQFLTHGQLLQRILLLELQNHRLIQSLNLTNIQLRMQQDTSIRGLGCYSKANGNEAKAFNLPKVSVLDKIATIQKSLTQQLQFKQDKIQHLQQIIKQKHIENTHTQQNQLKLQAEFNKLQNLYRKEVSQLRAAQTYSSQQNKASEENYLRKLKQEHHQFNNHIAEKDNQITLLKKQLNQMNQQYSTQVSQIQNKNKQKIQKLKEELRNTLQKQSAQEQYLIKERESLQKKYDELQEKYSAAERIIQQKKRGFQALTKQKDKIKIALQKQSQTHKAIVQALKNQVEIQRQHNQQISKNRQEIKQSEKLIQKQLEQKLKQQSRQIKQSCQTVLLQIKQQLTQRKSDQLKDYIYTEQYMAIKKLQGQIDKLCKERDEAIRQRNLLLEQSVGQRKIIQELQLQNLKKLQMAAKNKHSQTKQDINDNQLSFQSTLDKVVFTKQQACKADAERNIDRQHKDRYRKCMEDSFTYRGPIFSQKYQANQYFMDLHRKTYNQTKRQRVFPQGNSGARKDTLEFHEKIQQQFLQRSIEVQDKYSYRFPAKQRSYQQKLNRDQQDANLTAQRLLLPNQQIPQQFISPKQKIQESGTPQHQRDHSGDKNRLSNYLELNPKDLSKTSSLNLCSINRGISYEMKTINQSRDHPDNKSNHQANPNHNYLQRCQSSSLLKNKDCPRQLTKPTYNLHTRSYGNMRVDYTNHLNTLSKTLKEYCPHQSRMKNGRVSVTQRSQDSNKQFMQTNKQKFSKLREGQQIDPSGLLSYEKFLSFQLRKTQKDQQFKIQYHPNESPNAVLVSKIDSKNNDQWQRKSKDEQIDRLKVLKKQLLYKQTKSLEGTLRLNNRDLTGNSKTVQSIIETRQKMNEIRKLTKKRVGQNICQKQNIKN